VEGHARIVFFSAESFFLRGGCDSAVFNQGSRAVVIEGRDTENSQT
jgi:hypothetical protein